MVGRRGHAAYGGRECDGRDLHGQFLLRRWAQYRAEYFANRTLTGTPLFTRCETAINNNWGNGGPGNGIPNDNFSVRWTGRFNFTAGSRTFTTVSDDGVRLWVDNVLVINRWTDHGPTTDRATRTMTAGTHDIKVEYYERTGGAVMQVSW